VCSGSDSNRLASCVCLHKRTSVCSLFDFSPRCGPIKRYVIVPEMVGHCGRCAGICDGNFGLRDSGNGLQRRRHTSEGDHISFLSDLHARDNRRRRCNNHGRRSDYLGELRDRFSLAHVAAVVHSPVVARRRTPYLDSPLSLRLLVGSGFENNRIVSCDRLVSTTIYAIWGLPINELYTSGPCRPLIRYPSEANLSVIFRSKVE
jgi:hypothetical protein